MRSKKEGYKLFFDLLRDMDMSHEMINYGFYAVKRNTYELTGCHETAIKEPSDFEALMARKNVNIVHINHARTIYRGEDVVSFKTFMNTWFTDFKGRKEITGCRRMLLFLLAYHLFYGYLITDMVLRGITYHYFALIVLIQIAFFIVVRSYTKHHILNFVLLPIYMLYFDFMLMIGSIKRFFYQRKTKKLEKQYAKEHENEDLLP